MEGEVLARQSWVLAHDELQLNWVLFRLCGFSTARRTGYPQEIQNEARHLSSDDVDPGCDSSRGLRSTDSFTHVHTCTLANL